MPKQARASPTVETETHHELDSSAAPRAPEKESKMKVDFDNVSITSAPRPKGEYPGKLVGHNLELASASSGQPTVTMQYQDLAAPDKLMWANYSLQPQSLWKIKRDLIRVGADVETMNSKGVDIEAVIVGLYGYEATLQFGEPRPDKNDPTKLYSNFLGIKEK